MGAPGQKLTDEAARVTAMTAHDRSLLIEAGAGSGKTAVMAGRIALLLATGASPASMAAVTFTELAASELLGRVREFADRLLDGNIPQELRAALLGGLSDDQKSNLETACQTIDEITCSTIHGFCQRLIKPYPVEADIDPGAEILDPLEAANLFDEVVDAWLRASLAVERGTLLSELVFRSPSKAIEMVHDAAQSLREHRILHAGPAPAIPPLVRAFRDAAAEFGSFTNSAPAAEEETARIAECFREMADNVAFAADCGGEPEIVVRLLTAEPHSELCTTGGSFRKFQKKGKWETAAKAAGLSKIDGAELNACADRLHAACCDAWGTLLQAAAGQVLAELVALLEPVNSEYRARKRVAAKLDFNDLIFAARDLLRDHPSIRAALAQRFRHLLVDEFQDTDPLQTEIFWRLCGEAPGGGSEADWRDFSIRPGALFLVGDPKQAIYRFRGADVAAYLAARDVFRQQHPDDILSISTNFRSCESILTFVNKRFEAPLGSDGQPGFKGLDAFHDDPADTLCVVALDVHCAGEDGKASAERQRDCEAEAVADLCARLIGSWPIRDHRSGEDLMCRPGDIALLAPTGTDLWRYEEALERRNIPVATQAGKGFYRRQEVQDLIALTRALADGRDTLALGALLRGPLVGLSEERLLDLVWTQPRKDEAPDRVPRLSIHMAAEAIADPLARDVIEKLQLLRRRINSTTPYQLLSEAVDLLRVRPLLLQRHRGQAERPLANVDLYLNLARPYANRGLRAFSDTMRGAWEDRSRAPEGRPDAQEEAVSLFTIHASKGLEWPVVLPVNTMTSVNNIERPIVDRLTGRLFMKVMGVSPPGHADARTAELSEASRERQRLWYVAATRARQLLALPRLDVKASSSSWSGVVDLGLDELESFDPSLLPDTFGPLAADEPNPQSREIFAAEAQAIAASEQPLKWLAPSRDEDPSAPLSRPEEPAILASPEEAGDSLPIPIQGGRNRGLILHKLMEEVLTGETREEELEARAGHLIVAIGETAQEDPARGLSPGELADSVLRGLRLPEVAALRPRLIPEVPVYGTGDEGSIAIHGVADAVFMAETGEAEVVIDWKSDTDPSLEAVAHYKAQIGSYRQLLAAREGLVVFLTSGRIERTAS